MSHARKMKSVKADDVATSRVKFTHIDRVVYPEKGYTKGDVVEYYLRVADKLLPHLRDRPLTLERLPEGVVQGGPHFWQKNTPAYYPRWIKRARLPTQDAKPVEYVLANDLESLMYLVNQNVLTLHVWFSRITSPDVPDFVLFDIDPHQSTFPNAVRVARALHALLDDEGVDNFVKTSGKSGLHVMTPWERKRGPFDAARTWAATIAQRVADSLPKIATTERTISRRGNRVYVDAMQNAKGKHAVPPYVLRAAPAASVAMPLDWKELNAKLTPAKFEMKAALKRIEKMKKDPLSELIGQ
jgi:bifunctional non-homologous end joining protein LigD